jgi:hypothetical protein
MTLSLTCKHCGEMLTGDVEDELVARVQTHVSGHARDHGRDHAISREQILARLARQQSKEQLPTGNGE